MTVDDIPKAWKHALAAVQSRYPEAVMAGGCLRDRDLGVKVKDIDIFVPCNSVEPEEGRVVREALKGDGWRDVETIHDKTYNGNRISMALMTKYPGCPPVNIIVMPYALIEFDFGICQIEFNGQRLLRTRDYILDSQKKVFRLIPTVDDNSFVRTINRWARLKEKYPTWRFELGSRRADPFTVAVSSAP